jgi:hypothetical protein
MHAFIGLNDTVQILTRLTNGINMGFPYNFKWPLLLFAVTNVDLVNQQIKLNIL